MFIYAAIKFFGCKRLAFLRSWNKSLFTPEVELVERLSFGAFDSSSFDKVVNMISELDGSLGLAQISSEF